jgi:hypothetical protein
LTRIAPAAPRTAPSPSVGRRVARAERSTIDPGLEESADLYFRRPPKALAYQHFDNAESAILFVRDNLTTVQVASAVLEVGERRFEGTEVAAMVKGVRPARYDA